MGAGASTASRLRKALVIRAFNLRSPNESLEDQFQPYTQIINGKRCISAPEIKKALDFDAPWVDDLFKIFFGEKVAMIEFKAFIDFCEIGEIPRINIDPALSKSSSAPVIGYDTLLVNSAKAPGQGLVGESVKGIGRPIPNRETCAERQVVADMSMSGKGESTSNQSPLEKSPAERVGPQDPDEGPGAASEPGPASDEGPGSTCDPLIEEPEDSYSEEQLKRVFFPAVGSSGLELAVRAGSSEQALANRAMWKKREVVRHERVVQYTTIDADGISQELVEKEINETEILHMECRETGEFAHREVTRFEQHETFNNEVVNEQQGAEEYVHLKSVEDEIEFLESTMPRKPPPETEAEAEAEPGGGGPGSNPYPRAADDEGPGVGREEDADYGYRAGGDDAEGGKEERSGGSRSYSHSRDTRGGEEQDDRRGGGWDGRRRAPPHMHAGDKGRHTRGRGSDSGSGSPGSRSAPPSPPRPQPGGRRTPPPYSPDRPYTEGSDGHDHGHGHSQPHGNASGSSSADYRRDEYRKKEGGQNDAYFSPDDSKGDRDFSREGRDHTRGRGGTDIDGHRHSSSDEQQQQHHSWRKGDYSFPSANDSDRGLHSSSGGSGGDMFHDKAPSYPSSGGGGGATAYEDDEAEADEEARELYEQYLRRDADRDSRMDGTTAAAGTSNYAPSSSSSSSSQRGNKGASQREAEADYRETNHDTTTGPGLGVPRGPAPDKYRGRDRGRGDRDRLFDPPSPVDSGGGPGPGPRRFSDHGESDRDDDRGGSGSMKRREADSGDAARRGGTQRSEDITDTLSSASAAVATTAGNGDLNSELPSYTRCNSHEID